MNKLFSVVKPIIITLIFVFALYFENAAYERLIILISVFTIYLIWQFIRNIFQRKLPYLFIIDGLLILILEHYSRYLINYSFHFIFIVIIIEMGMTLDKRKDINILSGIIALFSLSKFLYAVYMIPNGKTVAELIFNLFAQVFIITLVNYSKLQKEEKRKNEQLYRELLLVHEKLKDYNEALNEKSVFMERNRIAGELHDSLGHNLTTLIMQLEMVDYLNKSSQDVSDIIGELKVNARDALAKAREVVSTLQEDRGKDLEDIDELINRFAKDTKVNINFRYPKIEISGRQGEVLYRVIQESLTNALRHGKCTEIHINLQLDNETLYFEIEDNGIGSKGMGGFGQRNMKKRIKTIGGKLEIVPGRPYKIKGSFPMRSGANG